MQCQATLLAYYVGEILYPQRYREMLYNPKLTGKKHKEVPSFRLYFITHEDVFKYRRKIGTSVFSFPVHIGLDVMKI